MCAGKDGGEYAEGMITPILTCLSDADSRVGYISALNQLYVLHLFPPFFNKYFRTQRLWLNKCHSTPYLIFNYLYNIFVDFSVADSEIVSVRDPSFCFQEKTTKNPLCTYVYDIIEEKICGRIRIRLLIEVELLI